MPHFASMSQVIDWILIYWLRGNILKERLSIILFWFEKLNDVTYESLATMHWNNGYTMFFIENKDIEYCQNSNHLCVDVFEQYNFILLICPKLSYYEIDIFKSLYLHDSKIGENNGFKET